MFKLINTANNESVEISDKLYHSLAHHNEVQFKRRSRLYIPLTKERFIEKSAELSPDGFIFDLEDSIPVDLKEKARKNIAKIPQKRSGIEYILRINDLDTDFWQEDLKGFESYPFDSVMIPKVESAETIEKISAKLRQYKLKKIVLIESIKGLKHIDEIVDALSPGDAIGYGAGDISLAFGVSRVPIYESIVLQQALMQILMVAKDSGIDVFDPPYRTFSDLVTLKKESEFCRKLGTTGKQAIHPTQIDIINQVYSPSAEEITRYITEALAFENNPEKQAIGINGRYVGNPSRRMAAMKLKEFACKGYVRVEQVSDDNVVPLSACA